MRRRDCALPLLRVGVLAMALLLALSGAAGSARAQAWPSATTPATVALYQMPRPDYDPLGIPLGGFLLFPTAAEAPAYDDNIFASEQHRFADFVNTTTESLAVASQWSRHSLTARLYSAQQLYKIHSSEDANTYGAETSGRLDITADSFLQLNGSFVQQPQQRAALLADTNLGTRPIYNTASGTLTYDQRLNRWLELAQVSAQRVVYITGGEANRDGDLYTLRDRVSYDLSEQLALFAQAGYALQQWDLRPDARNADRLTGLLGVSAEIPTVLKGELGIGVLRETYANSAFKTLVTPALSAELIWNVLPLTSIVASADRTVVGTETFCDAASGVCQTSSGTNQQVVTAFGNQRNTFEATVGKLGVQHEFWHNLLGEVAFRYERDVFDFNNLIDNTYALSGDMRYLLNRYAEVDLNFTHTQRTANLSEDRTFNSGPYTENLLFLTLKVGL